MRSDLSKQLARLKISCKTFRFSSSELLFKRFVNDTIKRIICKRSYYNQLNKIIWLSETAYDGDKLREKARQRATQIYSNLTDSLFPL